MLERVGWVESAIERLKHNGIGAEGQVATTRHGVKLIARIAKQRHVSHVFVEGTSATGWRRWVEGDLGSELKRKLRHSDIQVIIVSSSKT